MFRLVPTFLLTSALAGLALPALAADYSDFGTMRGSYEDGEDESPLSIEAGLRYWYSMGGQNFAIASETMSAEDRSHFLEGHLRIDDASTRTFVKGLAGYSVAINGLYNTPLGSGSIVDGRIGYAGADFGYLMLGEVHNGLGLGGLVGYQYWNDSPNMGRESFTTATKASDIQWSQNTGAWSVGYDSEPNNIDIHALRLGLTGRVEMGDFFDIDAELAAVPYAWVNGTLGAYGVASYDGGAYTQIQSSPVSFTGHGYGAMGQLMFGINPSENLAFRIGGRAWYLQGNMDSTFDVATIGHPTDANPQTVGPAPTYTVSPNLPNFDTAPTFAEQTFISTSNAFSLFRYGVMAELTYKF